MGILKFITFSMFFILLSSSLEAKNNTEYLGLFDMKKKSYTITKDGKNITIQRVFTKCAKNKGFFQPYVPAKGVTAVTETEILYALNDKDSVVVDMRIQDHYFKGTIPTAVNIPYGEIGTRLDELGCTDTDNGWNCSKAKKVYGFCNGPVCAQSPIGIRAMIKNGFPANKIFYYRGGMFNWSALGLTEVKGEF